MQNVPFKSKGEMERRNPGNKHHHHCSTEEAIKIKKASVENNETFPVC